MQDLKALADSWLTDGKRNEDYYYHYDGLGSVMVLTDMSGYIVENYAYDVYGQANVVSIIGNPYLFTGRHFDSETGLYYYRARYYSFTIGRFLQVDPFYYKDSFNLYLYCKNSPINFVDPWGLEIRIYSSNAFFDVPGFNHAFVYSTETGRGIGRSGKSGYSWGNGVGDLDSPYVIVELKGMSESEFMDRIEAYPGWNRGIWLPWYDDCHTELAEAFEFVGVHYPGAPGGRVDFDEIITDAWRRTVDFIKDVFSRK